MQTLVKYRSEIKTVTLGGGMITVESMTPILTQKERERRRREIEKQLYDVFKKYTDKQVMEALQ